MWDTRYRPLVFGDVLGQGGTAEVLRARLKQDNAFEASYTFSGGHGSGKTTTARILARGMLCANRTESGDPCNQCDSCVACLKETHQAFTELDAASHGTVAEMRQLVDGLVYNIPGARKRIYLLDEAHRMSKDAQDVLLKPVEEKRMVLILCTTEKHKLQPTLVGRTDAYDIRRITREDIFERMKMVLGKEKVEYEEEAVLTVIDVCDGHVRDILNKLEMVSQLGPITVEAVQERLNLSVVSAYYRILLALGNPAEVLPLIEEACSRVSPSDVASGLAEAAMNAYRHANKIHSDVPESAKDLAVQIFDRYKGATTEIAAYFLRNNQTSKLHLTCDILRFCKTGGVPLVETMVQSVPVVVAAPVVVASAPVVAAAPVETTPEPEASPAPNLVVLHGQKDESTPEPLKTTPPPALKIAVDPAKEKLKRSDGIGPKGSSDPHALTSKDHLAIPDNLPRDYRREEARKGRSSTKRSDEEQRALTPKEFTNSVLKGLDS